VKFEVFMAVKVQVKVFWIVMPCSVVVGTNILEDLPASILKVK
jgi:hypothetical protein